MSVKRVCTAVFVVGLLAWAHQSQLAKAAAAPEAATLTMAGCMFFGIAAGARRFVKSK